MKAAQNCDLNEIVDWLSSTFSKIEILSSLSIIGSILDKNLKETNDVDIVQQIQFENSPKLSEYTRRLSLIRCDFNKEFSLSLHITTFTQNELKEFVEFMAQNRYLKII